MRRHPGIYVHEGLVYPVPIDLGPKNIPVRMEPGFTFEIPRKLKKELALLFLESTKQSYTQEEYEKKRREIIKRYSIVQETEEKVTKKGKKVLKKSIINK